MKNCNCDWVEEIRGRGGAVIAMRCAICGKIMQNACGQTEKEEAREVAAAFAGIGQRARAYVLADRNSMGRGRMVRLLGYWVERGLVERLVVGGSRAIAVYSVSAKCHAILAGRA